MNQSMFDFTKGKIVVYIEDYVKSFLYIKAHDMATQMDTHKPTGKLIIPLFGDVSATSKKVNIILQSCCMVDTTLIPPGGFMDVVNAISHEYFKDAGMVGFGVISSDETSYSDLKALTVLLDKYVGVGKGVMLIKNIKSTDMRIFAGLPDGVRELNESYVYYSRQSPMIRYINSIKGLEKCETEEEENLVKENVLDEKKREVVHKEEESSGGNDVIIPKPVNVRRPAIVCFTLGIIALGCVMYYEKYYGVSYGELKACLKEFALYKFGTVFRL